MRGRNESGIGKFGKWDKELFGVGFLLVLVDLLHLEHFLHDELVLALFVGVALILALPREVELGLPAPVERDAQVGTLVPIRQRNPGLHHLLLLCHYHLLR